LLDQNSLNRRRVFEVFVIVPVALLAYALVLQHFGGQKPCPLCILQRDGFLLFALIALAGAIHNPARRGAAVYAGGLVLSALAGLGVAINHVWVLYHPKFGCGIDVLEQFVNGLFTAKLLPFFFYANGDCSDRHESILGLTAPEWSLIWFSVLFAGAAWFCFKWFAAAPAKLSA
jgi:disulfide bond formation protein DsbB